MSDSEVVASGTGLRLMSSQTIGGTDVYNAEGECIGSIEEVIIDRASGRVAYAVMSFSRWLGIGQLYHPLPWSVLDHAPELHGYRVAIDRKTLQRAPAYAKDEILANGATWREFVHHHYGASPFWS